MLMLLDCYSGFNSEDPGVEQAAQTLFEIDPELVQADLGVKTLNGETIEQFKNKVPANVALGIFSCLKKCGIPVETRTKAMRMVATHTHMVHLRR